MRLWSISLKYLDAKGLVALWREALLAKNVLEGKTKGYKNHPQLIRFKKSSNPIIMINIYLKFVYEEASSRGYKFSKDKFIEFNLNEKIKVNSGQVSYELEHLRKKLGKRSIKDLENLPKKNEKVEVVKIFESIDGPIEPWEIISE